MNPPHDAQYYFVKNTTWLDNEEDDWLEDLDDGADVYLKEVSSILYWWNRQQRSWIKSNKSLDAVACYRNNNFGEGPILKKVINPETMAEATVKIAKILRDYGIDECRYNESLNCLQYVIVRNYLDEWASQPAASQSGAYDYWEAVHKKLGITRPHDKPANSSS